MPEPPKDTWLKLVVLTVIVLALAAGISAFKAMGYATRVQIYAAQEARQWQDYQVESIKKDNYGLNRDTPNLPEACGEQDCQDSQAVGRQNQGLRRRNGPPEPGEGPD